LKEVDLKIVDFEINTKNSYSKECPTMKPFQNPKAQKKILEKNFIKK